MSNYEIFFTGQMWQVEHPSIGVMAQLNGNNLQIYPESNTDWILLHTSGLYETFHDVPFDCRGKQTIKKIE